MAPSCVVVAMTGAYVLLVALAVALAFGGWRLRTDGRFASRRAREESALDVGPAADLLDSLGVGLGERATLVQFSSAFCAPCRTTRVVLSRVAQDVDGVTHVEVDAEQHLQVTRDLGILRTPTTIVLDARGAEVSRAAGAPTRDQVLVALAGALD